VTEPATHSQFRRLRSLFDRALELDDTGREELLARTTADDPDLGVELGDLLHRYQSRQMLADAPPLGDLDAALRVAVPDAFAEGRTIGAFKLVEQIGDGGMGRVFRAQRDGGEIEQAVAIKLVRSELLNPALLKRFSTERRVLAGLNHPNICGFLDAGNLSDGTPYVVMELVDGEPLYDYCDRHRLDPSQRVRLLRRIAAAVGHAHGHLVVHRDIKSSNVLIQPDGEPKLLDFGIAKSLSGQDRQQTRTAERFFTPANAAPEQFRGEPVGVGCDIYALGVLAYELLSGRPPFDIDGLRAGEIERLLLDVPPPPMSARAVTAGPDVANRRALPDVGTLARTLSGDLDSIVATCLRKSPEERYSSIELLDADLGAVLERRPIRARRGDRRYRIRKFVERHRLAVTLAATLALTFVIGATLVAWQAISLAEQRNRVVLERDRAQQAVQLLQDAFVSADPAQLSGGSVSTRDVLAAARPRISALSETRPDLYASLAATLADVELKLGLEADAAELANGGIAAARRIDDTASLRQLLLIAGNSLASTGDLMQAGALLDEVRAMDASEQPDWMVAQGHLLRSHGRDRRDDTLALLERAVSALDSRGPTDELANRARWEWVLALRQSGDYAAAVERIEATLAWQRAQLPEGHPRVVLSRLHRMDLLRLQGEHDAAVREGREVYDQIVSVYGATSPLAARAGAALGLALLGAGELEQAIDAYDLSRRTWERSFGPNHPQTVTATFNLSSMYAQRSDPAAQALALARQAAAGAEVAFGPASNRAAYMRIALARKLIAAGESAEAMQWLTSEAAIAGHAGAVERNRSEHLKLLREAAQRGGCDPDPDPAATPPCRRAAGVLHDLAAAAEK
jgi:serine/threonine protein kinase/tetratricopeptide (TPR) repeat protein